ncbi:MAG: MlaD family protein [Phycisphaeraceae bacterium]
MNERIRHVIVGLTAIGGLVSLCVLMLMFGYLPDWLEDGYRVPVHMTDAGGLTVDSAVKLNGIKIGRVIDVQLKEPASDGVVATMLIRPEHNVPKDVKATISQALLGGSPTLTLDASHLAGKMPVGNIARDGSESITAISSTLSGQIESAMKGPTEQFERLVNNFEDLSKSWTQIAKNIHTMTERRTPADVDKSNGELEGNITTVLARADQRLKEMEDSIAGVNALLNDPKLRQDLHETFANANKISRNIEVASADASKLVTKIDGTVDKVDSLIDGAKDDLDQLTKRYIAVADDMSGAIQSMKKTIDLAREGDGTVAKLINDPALYNNLNDSAKRLESALTDLKLLIQKWDKEGILKF